jgi:hypothetical protein
MSVSLHTLALTSRHPLGVFQVGGLAASTVTVVSGSDVFYGEQDLNADEYAGRLKEGESKTFISPTWLLSKHSSRLEVRDYTAEPVVEQLRVGSDGRVKHTAKKKAAIVGVKVDKPKRKKRKPTEALKAREHTAEPHRPDPKRDPKRAHKPGHETADAAYKDLGVYPEHKRHEEPKKVELKPTKVEIKGTLKEEQ